MIEFTIYIEARPVQTGGKRMFLNKKTSKPVFFKDKETQAYLDAITLLARPHAPRQPLAGPIRVDYLFVMERPARLNRKGDFDGLIPHVTRPDLDNLQKGTQDALSQAGFWLDDSQICCGYSSKRTSEKTGKARITVTITELNDTPEELGLI